MDSYSFRIRIRDALGEVDQDRLYGAFDEEISVETGPKGHWVGFERPAESFLDAVVEALKQVIDLGFEALAIEDELVSIADIAERTGRTRQSVSMLVSGQRGGGGFPVPAAGNVRSPLWRWGDVAPWFESDGNDQQTIGDRSQVVAAINGALATQALARDHPGDLERIRAAVGGGEDPIDD